MNQNNQPQQDVSIDNNNSEITVNANGVETPNSNIIDNKPINNNNNDSQQQSNNNNNQQQQTEFTCIIPNISQKESPFYTNPQVLWGLTWKVYIFPKGNNCPDDLSLFLDMNEIKQPNFPNQKVNFVMEVVNQRNAEDSIRKTSDHIFTVKSTDWGFNKFMKLAQLYDSNSGFIKDDTLILKVQIYNVIQESNQRGVFMYNSKKTTGFVGLKNQGATCYMNSLLQALYQISSFRKAVYELPTTSTTTNTTTNNNLTNNNTNNNLTNNNNPNTNNQNNNFQSNEISIPLALQRLFYKMQFGNTAVSTKELTKSFGWGTHDIFTQHDVQELNRVLCDNLNDKMKGTKAEGTIDNHFRGQIKNFIKCEKVKYESTREEYFYDLSLNVKGCKDILTSFDKYIEIERLDGSNQYDAEGFGLQDANKGCSFLSFPPVLHLQLKRFEYDPIRDANVKVNDRYTFPDRLDLTPYLDESADKSITSIYKLQGVLVHSGDLHNGHYYAFLKPSRNGDWLKFDDEDVSKCSFSQVTEESFGSDIDTLSRFPVVRNYTNAYMLIYLRDKEMDELLKPILDSEIPEHLKERIECEDKKLAIQTMRFKMTTDEDFVNHNSFDLVDFSKIPFQSIIWKTSETMNVAYLKRQLTTLFGIPPERQRIWSWATRKNKSIRIDALPESDDTRLTEIRDKSSYSEIRLHLEISYIPRPLNMNDQYSYFQSIGQKERDKEYALVFFKYYDPQLNQVKFVGSKVIDVYSKVSLIVPLLCQLAHLPVNTPLLIYEEVFDESIDPIKPNEIFKKLEIGNGDIIVFQKPISITEKHLYSTIIQYFDYVRHKIVVVLRQVDNNNLLLNQFTLELSKEMKYSQITKTIAKHINIDSSKIRLMSSPRFFGPDYYSPIKPNDNISLYDILNSNNKISDQLFFEVLSIPVSECEFKRNFKLTYQKLNQSFEKISLWVNKNGTVLDLKNSFVNIINQQPLQQQQQQQKLLQPNQQTLQEPIIDSTKLKLYEIRMYKIEREFKDDMVLNYIMENSNLKMEVQSEDEMKMQPTDKLVQVVHFNNETYPIYHSIPFTFVVSIGESFTHLRSRLQQRVNVSQNEFSRWKIAIIQDDKIEFLQDDYVFKDGQYMIGLYHHPSAANKHQKAIKINN